MAKLLAGCESLPEQDRAIFGAVEALLSSHWGEGLGIAHQDSNFGKLTAVCGMVAVEDGQLKISLDSRYGTQCDPTTLERRLHTVFDDAGWEIVYMNNRPGYLVDEASSVPGLFSDIYTAMSGSELPCYYMSGGTYARNLKNAFVVGSRASHADWPQPSLELPAGHGGAHQRDEAIDIEGFFLAVRLLAQYVLACDRLLNKQ
jgi:acetylornithine deacetylase/succinyl-diaminopimelate desuccinylase-like protein